MALPKYSALDMASLEHAFAKATAFGTDDRIRLYNKLYRFASREYDIKVALQGQLRRFQAKQDPRRQIWRRWIAGVTGGYKFHEVIGPYIPDAERMMLSAGEESGSLAQGFAKAEYVADSTKRIKSALVGALTYPAALLVLLCLVLYLVATRMMPELENILDVPRWPVFAQHLYTLSSWVRDYGLYALIALITTIITIIKTFPVWRGPTRRWLDSRIPPWTIYREVTSANMLISLAALVSTGRPIDDALKSIRRVSSPWLSWHVDRFRNQMIMGKPAGQAIDTGLLNAETTGDLEDYGAAGAFEEAIEMVGKHVVEDAIRSISKAARVLNIIALMAVAGVMIWMYASMAFVGMAVQKAAMSGPI